MKRIANAPVLIVSIVLLINFSCKKTIEPADSDRTTHQTDSTAVLTGDVPYPVKPVLDCNYAPNYGDSVLFSQPGSAGDVYVHPVNNQGIKGTYLSWPVGLDLDAQTGAIDVTRSESGQRFSIAFVHEGSADTCMSNLIVGGAAYMDSIYQLSQSSKTAVPYFNANPNTPNPCLNNSGTGCRFDYNEVAERQGIEVDYKTGYIDLARTMLHYPFGFFPKNGATVLTTIQYQLDDNSNQAPQQIQIKLIYYNSRSDVPDNLISIIKNRVGGIINTQVTGDGPTKPPIIIITRNK
jgi:hypothetical protein